MRYKQWIVFFKSVNLPSLEDFGQLEVDIKLIHLNLMIINNYIKQLIALKKNKYPISGKFIVLLM
jgi:hypothetical protein